jgi:Leucine-rich repeat (LRR) protein
MRVLLLALIACLGCSRIGKRSIQNPDVDLSRGIYVAEYGGSLAGDPELRKDNITDEDLEKLLARWPTVTKLNLSGRAVTGDGLVSLQTPNALTELNLSGTSLSDPQVNVILTFTELSALYLAGTQITDDGIELLLELPKLRYLALDNTQITDRGLAILSKSSTLERVSLRGTGVTEALIAEVTQKGCSIAFETRSVSGRGGGVY